jgi:hypothetical protein
MSDQPLLSGFGRLRKIFQPQRISPSIEILLQRFAAVKYHAFDIGGIAKCFYLPW